MNRAILPPPLKSTIRRYRRWLVLTALCGFAASASDIGVSLVFRHLLDHTLHKGGAFVSGLATALAIVAGLYGLKTAGRFVQRRAAETAGQGVARDLRVNLFERLLRLPVEFFHERAAGRILLRFANDLNAIRRFVSTGLSNLLADGVAALCILAAAVAIEWRLGLALVVLAPVQFFLIRRLNPRLRKFNRRVRTHRARLTGIIQDDLSAIEALKVFRSEPNEVRRVAERSDKMYRTMIDQVTVAARAEASSVAVLGAATLYVLGYGSWLVHSGEMTRGTLVAFFSLFHHLFPSVRRLVLANESLQTSRVQVARVMSFLDRPPEAQAAEVSVVPRGGTLVIERIDGKVDLEAHPGELVAVIGPSGSGKTTLVSYLLGFRRPSSGRILVDGQDVTNAAPAEFRRLFSWTAADAPVLRRSLLVNVRLGNRGSSQEEVNEALRASTLDRVITRHEGNGLKRGVGPAGRRLSGGERALLALARALLAKRPFLILDEPFTGLDPDTIETLWVGLDARRRRGTTILLFTTDRSAAARADRVVRLERTAPTEEARTSSAGATA